MVVRGLSHLSECDLLGVHDVGKQEDCRAGDGSSAVNKASTAGSIDSSVDAVELHRVTEVRGQLSSFCEQCGYAAVKK